MKAAAVLLIAVLVCPAPLAAQEPASLLSQARAETARDVSRSDDPRLLVLKKEMEHPILFWTGAALLAIGVASLVASASWERDSDLSNEFQSVRLGRDLAPCGTDPKSTALPIADCKINAGLAWIGGGLALAGGGLMVIGGKQIETVQRRPMLAATIRF